MNARLCRNRQRLGLSLVETLIAATITMMVMFGSLSVFIASSGAWVEGRGRILSETETQIAVRRVVDELREASDFEVDGDGLGVTYSVPDRDGDGNFIPDDEGTERRIFHTAGVLWLSTPTSVRPIARRVILTDPRTSATYPIFEASEGVEALGVTVTLVTRAPSNIDTARFGRAKSFIAVRNRIQL